MVQVLNSELGGIGTRLGAGLGKGLADQLPKEVERSRLSSGLKNFEKESANLNPMQQLARLSAIPGITPQMIQSFGELGRQQSRAQAFNKSNNLEKPNPFPQNTSAEFSENASKVPSLTKEESFGKAQEGYIPPTEAEKFADAEKEYNENPGRWGNDPQKAIDFVEKKALTDEKIALAHQKRHADLNILQNGVIEGLKNHANNLGVKVPANIYSDIENEAVQATKPKADGGRGLTEQQAKKEYGAKLDERSRDYESINALGGWGITSKKAADTLNSMKSLQQKFEKHNDTENFGEKLISQGNLSPSMAFSIAEPVSREPQLNKEISRIKPIKEIIGFKQGRLPLTPVTDAVNERETLKLSEKLASLLGEKGSPLAVAHELAQKGYDASIWMKYLTDNKRKLNLSANQERQLDKPNSFIEPMNDWWLGSWSGIEETK